MKVAGRHAGLRSQRCAQQARVVDVLILLPYDGSGKKLSDLVIERIGELTSWGNRSGAVIQLIGPSKFAQSFNHSITQY